MKEHECMQHDNYITVQAQAEELQVQPEKWLQADFSRLPQQRWRAGVVSWGWMGPPGGWQEESYCLKDLLHAAQGV